MFGCFNIRRTPRILNPRAASRQVVRSGLTIGKDRVGKAPASDARKHSVVHDAGCGIHLHHRHVCSGRAGSGVRCRNRRVWVGGQLPGFWLVAHECVDLAVVGTALGVPPGCVAQRQHVKRVERDDRICVVVIALQTVDDFGAVHFLRWFTRVLQATGNAVPFHRVFGRQKTRKGGDAKRRMRVCVSRSKLRQALLRLFYRDCCLAVTWNCVVFGIAQDGRSVAVSPFGRESSGHASRVLFNCEALFTQALHVPLS